MSARPKFNTLYKGEWKFPCHLGVGLRFTGTPTDVDAIVKLLWEHSCHVNAGRQIMQELIDTGHRDVTVMYLLDFDKIAKQLAEFGVTISIIPPKFDPDEV